MRICLPAGDFVPKAGHIKGAVNLPPGLLFNADGTYKNKAEIEAIVKPVVGADLDKEIIVYCDTGRRSSAAAYILVERGFEAYVLKGGLTNGGVPLRRPS